MPLKLGAVVIEVEDLAVLPSVGVDIDHPGRPEVRWDLRPARVRDIALRDGERVEVAVTRLGKQRVRRAIERADAEAVFVGASGGMARCRGTARDGARLAEIVQRELWKPGSLVAEIHARDYGDKEEEDI